MPFVIKMRGGKHCVHKEGNASPISGGCHDTHEQAVRHQRAFIASEAASAGRASLSAVGERITVTVSKPPGSQEQTEQIEENRLRWEGVLGIEGHPTDDGRYVMPGQVGERDMPMPLFVQTRTAEGHEGAEVCGRIEAISHVPIAEFDRAEEFSLSDVREDAVVIWGEGTLDASDHAEDAQRMIENGADVSIDGLQRTGQLLDAETFEEIDTSLLELGDLLEALFGGRYLQVLAGDIGGVTIVGLGAFREARIGLVAASLRLLREESLTASAAPLKPPRAWFDDPQLRQLTPLTITSEGRIYGHLADWSGCHTGFSAICVPPFRSPSNFAYFNTGEVETVEGDLVSCGKLMFSRDGGKHAPVSRRMSVEQVVQHYDDATKVGGFVRAGSDRFGTWLAGVLRHDLREEDVQHLRSHPPSGDWRPIPGRGTELVAAFSVPVPGFPIPRALIASAEDGLTLISGPLALPRLSRLERYEKRKTLRERAVAALGR